MVLVGSAKPAADHLGPVKLAARGRGIEYCRSGMPSDGADWGSVRVSVGDLRAASTSTLRIASSRARPVRRDQHIEFLALSHLLLR